MSANSRKSLLARSAATVVGCWSMCCGWVAGAVPARPRSLVDWRTVTDAIRTNATRFGLTVFEVDGSLSLDETDQMLASYFGPVIGAGSRARDGAERAVMRQAENAVALAQVEAFRAYLGDNAPADLPGFPFACECTTLGCGVEVPMTPAAYRAAGPALGHD